MAKMSNWFGFLLERWQQATLVDYCHMVLAVVLLGYFITRFSSR